MAVEDDPFAFDDEQKDDVRVVEEGGEVIALSDDEDPTRPPETNEQRATRLEQKKARKTMLDRIEEKDRRISELEARMGELRGAQQTLQSSMQRPAVDPLVQELANLAAYEQKHLRAGQAEEMLAKQQNTQVSAEYRAAWEREQRAIEDRRQYLNAQRAVRDTGMQTEIETRRAIAFAPYKDLAENEQRRGIWNAEYLKLLAMGRPDNEATLAEAARRTRAELKLDRNPSTEVTPGDKAKLSGVRGVRAGNGGGGETFVMTQKFKDLAEARYQDRADLTQKQKWVLWAKEYGDKVKANIARREGRA